MPTFVLAQVCGALDCCFYLIGIFQKRKKNILSWQAVGCAIVSTQYLLLSAYDAAASNLIALFRNIAFSRGKSRIALGAIYLAYVVIAVVTRNGAWTIFMLVGSIGKATFSYLDSEQHLRVMNACFHMYWIIYNLNFGAYTGAVSNALMLAGCVLSYIKYAKIKKKEMEGEER